jgi:hypothetical protein
MVRDILSKVDVNEADDVFGTPLHAAIAGHRKEIVDILVKEYHADVNAPSVSFGNAVQMAVALGDKELLHLLVAHGARCRSSGGQARIWASVWEQISFEPNWFEPKEGPQVYYVSGGCSSLVPATNRPSSPWVTLQTSLPLYWRLRLLLDCVEGQNAVTKHIGRGGMPLAVRSREGPKSALSKKQLSSIIKHIQAADLGASCYTPMMVMWETLSFATRRDDRRNYRELIPVFEVVHRHESFLQRFGDSILDPDLEDVLIRLFSLACLILLGVVPGTALSRARKMRSIGVESESVLETTHNIRYLQKLGQEAVRLEEIAKGISAMNQLLSKHNERTTAALDTMANDMAEMKLQISQLTQSVQLLLELQQKSHPGMFPPLLLSRSGLGS